MSQLDRPIPDAMRWIVIVAAMQREIAPLVLGWKKNSVQHAGRNYILWESANAVAVAGGIGMAAAGQACRAVLAHYRPSVLVSAGLAGSLRSDLTVGAVIKASQVTDAANSRVYVAAGDGSHLITTTEVSGIDEKRRLAQSYRASAVDMEAAAIAEIAEQEKVPFIAIKGISDELNFTMPPLNKFIKPDGSFATLQFAMFALVRPRLWRSLLTLSGNTNEAIQGLTSGLRHLIYSQDFGVGAIESKKPFPVNIS